MSELIPVTLVSLLFAALSHGVSDYDHIKGKYIYKERFFYALVAVSLILFAGLRTGYNDTGTYLYIYKRTPESGNLLEGIRWLKFGENPGFVFTLRVLKRLNVSQQSFLMIFAVFTIGTNLWMIRKYSCNIFMSVLLFVTFAGFTFNLAAIKQCTAMAFCFIATDRAIQKKYIQFVIFVFIACLFHAYSFMYLVVPFLSFRPWGKYTIVMLVVFAIAGLGLQTMLGTLLNVTDMLGEGYDAAAFSGEGVHPIRLLAISAPVALSLLTAEQIAQRPERDQYIILNLTMLNAEIMFVALFGTANYFARLANYFLPFQAVSVPWLLNHFDRDGKRSLSIIASVCYFLFFIYSNAVHESFDQHFYSTTFWKYLQSLF